MTGMSKLVKDPYVIARADERAKGLLYRMENCLKFEIEAFYISDIDGAIKELEEMRDGLSDEEKEYADDILFDLRESESENIGSLEYHE